jgi:hypothetical protein
MRRYYDFLRVIVYICLVFVITVTVISNRSEYQEYFLGVKAAGAVGLTTLPSSYADCLEIWESQPPGTLRACPGLYRDCFTYYCYLYADWFVFIRPVDTI